MNQKVYKKSELNVQTYGTKCRQYITYTDFDGMEHVYNTKIKHYHARNKKMATSEALFLLNSNPNSKDIQHGKFKISLVF